jgi:hypothetical protein
MFLCSFSALQCMFRVTHKCLLAPHKSPNTVFLVQLEGQKLALLLEGLQFCTLRQKVSTESVFRVFSNAFLTDESL